MFEHRASPAPGCSGHPVVASWRDGGRSRTDRPAEATLSTPMVIPILVYADIQAGHDYLVETFGFVSGGIHRLEDGTVVHAEVRKGDLASGCTG